MLLIYPFFGLCAIVLIIYISLILYFWYFLHKFRVDLFLFLPLELNTFLFLYLCQKPYPSLFRTFVCLLVEIKYNFRCTLWWAGKDSNLRTQMRTDLQSAAFSHSATYPNIKLEWCSLKDSNLGPTGYEPVALTNWAKGACAYMFSTSKSITYFSPLVNRFS